MSQPILTQSFPDTINNKFSDTLQSFNSKSQNSFAPIHFDQSFSSLYNIENIHPKYEQDSHVPISPSMCKHTNFKPLSLIMLDTQCNSAELTSPTTTAFSRCDSKDEDNEDLSQKMKSPRYRQINSKEILRGTCQDNENRLGLNDKSKKILKRRCYKETDEANSNSSAKKGAKKGKRSSWSSAEDNKLMELMETYGKKWSKIAALMEGRTGKQVRDRYVNVLMPDINRTGWEESEDQLILSTYQQIGPKWSKIAENLQGRTEGQVKNRFYSFLKKKFGKLEESTTSPKEVEDSFFSISEQGETPVKIDNQEYSTLQQCLQRVEEISNTSFFDQKYPQYSIVPQSYFPYNYCQNGYYSSSYCSPQSSIKVSDPTDVISFDNFTHEAPAGHFYLAEYGN